MHHLPIACALSAPRRSAALGFASGGLSLVANAAAPCSRSLRFKQVIAESGLESWKVNDYQSMRDDVPRTSKFKSAIQRRLAGTREATVVDIGTGPFALLAVFAARAGARKVYAIEKNSEAATMAKALVAREGLEDRIQVIEGDSMQVVLPERVDLIVSELIGSIATQEGVEPIIRDARKRFLKPSSRCDGMIPARCQTCIAPIEYKGRSPFAKLFFPKDGLRSRGQPQPGTSLPLRIKAGDASSFKFLAPPQLLEDFDYCSMGGPDSREEEKALTFDIPACEALEGFSWSVPFRLFDLLVPPGEVPAQSFSGFAMWTKVVVDDEDSIDVRSQPDSHWAYVVAIMTANPVSLATPGVIALRSRVDYSAAPVRYTFIADVPVC